MKVETARILVAALLEAIDKAEAVGRNECSLTEQLQALDDAARAELEAAIKRAEGA